MDEHFSNVARAFSHKALEYDAFGEQHANLAAMRTKVRQHIFKYLQPGNRILELNAGTGGDAVFFARNGFRVHATDISPGMVAEIEAKISHFDLQEMLTVELCSFTSLSHLQAGYFDYVLSNMGGINCYPDLSEIVSNMRLVIHPGSTITWVIMPPICLWELASIFRDFRTATRRLRRSGTLAHIEGNYFLTYYFTARQVIRAFGSDFNLLEIQGLSVFTPPADRKTFSARHPRIYQVLRRLDRTLADYPGINQCGDFFIISFRYQPG